MVVIKQGGTAETAISDINETIDSITNYSFFLIAKWSSKGEIVKESDKLITTL
jgi:hypothetical protein